jgi:hypothetical protein
LSFFLHFMLGLHDLCVWVIFNHLRQNYLWLSYTAEHDPVQAFHGKTDRQPSFPKEAETVINGWLPKHGKFQSAINFFLFFFLLRGAVWIKLYLILFCREKGRSDLSFL